MKKILLFSFLACFLTLAFTNDAYAQKKKKKKSSQTDEYFDESGNFASKLWYAGGINVNWSRINAGFGREGTIFQFGLSPMVGYEIFEGLSAGVRLEFLYLSGRFDEGNGQDFKYNSVDLGPGIFSRYKFKNGFFLHGEYQSLNQKRPAVDFNGNFVTSRSQVDNLFIGAGYASGGIWGYEVYALYNTQEEFTSSNFPLYYRFGINYKFLQ